jgi:hypothetical protein
MPLYRLPISHTAPDLTLADAPRKTQSWNDALLDVAHSVPEAVALGKRLAPTIERVTPVAENVNAYIPYITAGIYLLSGALIFYGLTAMNGKGR